MLAKFVLMKSDRIKYHLIIGFLRAIAYLPFWGVYLFSDFVAFILHRLVGYRKKVVRKNIRNSFPEKNKKELRKIERQFYRYLCDSFIESIKMLHISDSEIKKRVHLSNSHLVTEALAGNHPIILFLGHYGNWEWVPAMLLMLDEPKTMGALYKPLQNRVMDEVMIRLRSRFNIVHIPHRTAYRRLLEMRQMSPSFMIGFIGDQRPLGDNLKHWTMFMNQPTAFVAGGETIGSRVNAHYLYVEAIREKRGHYVLNFRKMEVDPEDMEEFPYTRLFFRMLEQSIRNTPPYWLWSHNRWKAKPPVDFK